MLETALKHISPKQLQHLLTQHDIFLVDVREESERAICDIGGVLIPLSQFATRFDEIPKDKTIVVYCKAGGRSQNAAQFLLEQGYEEVINLSGGILAWIDQIEPNLKRY